MRWLVLLAAALLAAPAAAQGLPAPAQQLLDRARASDAGRFAAAMAMKPAILPTTDGRSYVLVWRPGGKAPSRWIATLHGHASYAATDLAVWRPFVEQRDIGVVALQWWLGTRQRISDYYAPEQLYHELDAVLRRVGARPERVLLHGFSRGSANVYAVAALDGRSRDRYFSYIVANAGGVVMDYPPNRMVASGGDRSNPYLGQKWITACGGRDPNPGRDGCPAMRAAAQFIQRLGGSVVLAIEDADGGHGAFHKNPANVNRALDLFERAR